MLFDVHSRLNKILKSKTSIFYNNFLCNSFGENFGSISILFFNNFFSYHVTGVLIPTRAKVGFWVRIVLHPNPIPNLIASQVESVKIRLDLTQLAI